MVWSSDRTDVFHTARVPASPSSWNTLLPDTHCTNTHAPCMALLTCYPTKQASINKCAKPHLFLQSPKGGKLHLGSILTSWFTYVSPESRTLFLTPKSSIDNYRILNHWIQNALYTQPWNQFQSVPRGPPMHKGHGRLWGLWVVVIPPRTACLTWTPHKDPSSKHWLCTKVWRERMEVASL